jgi:hypothetical protein
VWSPHEVDVCLWSHFETTRWRALDSLPWPLNLVSPLLRHDWVPAASVAPLFMGVLSFLGF